MHPGNSSCSGRNGIWWSVLDLQYSALCQSAFYFVHPPRNLAPSPALERLSRLPPSPWVHTREELFGESSVLPESVLAACRRGAVCGIILLIRAPEHGHHKDNGHRDLHS